MKTQDTLKGRRLSQERFDAARRFIMTKARPLERTRFGYEFEHGSPADVATELGRFRNADGGFGKSLESDMRTPESSALCTSIALRVLRDTKVDSGSPLAADAIRYLLKTLNAETGRWRIVPASVMLSPHAPWWNHRNAEELARGFGLNPTAEILGYLYDHEGIVPPDVLRRVRESVFARLSAAQRLEMHELMCYVRLQETPTLPEALRPRLVARLRDEVEASVSFDPATWTGYVLRPLGVIEGPESPFGTGHEESIAANLDFLIDSQQADGSWMPTWSWGDQYPDVWKLACVEWSGVLTLDNLITLKRFGRIAEM